jgi:gliding motility-associated-like protein
MIFDRWGNLVFESDSLSDGWDGKINHGFETAQQDVYVYKVSFRDGSNKKHDYIGSVTLIK